MVESLVRFSVAAIEVAAILVLLGGSVVAAAAGVVAYRSTTAHDAYRLVRRWLGRTILLALELLVAADIIGTVALEPTIDNVVVLAGIVLIRTFLSLSLEVEIEGRWPWTRATATRS